VWIVIWRDRHRHHAAHELSRQAGGAITAAFIARFGIGFAIGAARLPWPGWLVGLVFGLLLSIPDAIITKAYGPSSARAQLAEQLSAFSYQSSGTSFAPVKIRMAHYVCREHSNCIGGVELQER
jgi:hypothetical protein